MVEHSSFLHSGAVAGKGLKAELDFNKLDFQ